ncbi:P-loop NTPase family protein [Limnovirga soli]|uniref:AAA+ ATPase domain-containing protein n=1 Tax=Limnovirga soli TaxID=2656915 RepID=A0A8J8FEM9_9BACT|nr:hypothetical protein [Limnovirga soli]NNV54556.1 hypothetical protein [Limnovirga soli]
MSKQLTHSPQKGKLVNVTQLLQKTYEVISCSQKMKDCFGEMQDTFTMIVYGPSGNGKTNMLADVLKEFGHLGEVLYLSFEEGHGKTIQDLIIRHGLDKINIKFLDTEDFPNFYQRMKRKQSPKIVVIDSWQYSRWTFDDYKQLKESFVFGKTPGRRKIFIFISHADGDEPKGASAKEVKFDCNIKVHVKQFIGFIVSRFGSKRNYIVWEEGARAYWGAKFEQKVYRTPEPSKKKGKAKKPKAPPPELPPPEPVTNMQIAPPEQPVKPVFKVPLNQLEEQYNE